MLEEHVQHQNASPKIPQSAVRYYSHAYYTILRGLPFSKFSHCVSVIS